MDKTNISVKACLTAFLHLYKEADDKIFTWLVIYMVDGINIEEFLVRRGF